MSDLWYGAKCPECGWIGSSQDCEGGRPIADTGDFSPIVCPECFKKEKEIEVVEPDETELCNKIHDLEKRLAEEESKTKELRECLEDLLDVQNGPPLETYREAWEDAFQKGCDLISGKGQEHPDPNEEEK